VTLAGAGPTGDSGAADHSDRQRGEVERERRSIPPNVREAVNFYQTRGCCMAQLDRGDGPETDDDPGHYDRATRGIRLLRRLPWFARAFMKPHIEIENDPSVGAEWKS